MLYANNGKQTSVKFVKGLPVFYVVVDRKKQSTVRCPERYKMWQTLYTGSCHMAGDALMITL